MTTLVLNEDGTATLTFKQGSKTVFHIPVYSDEEETIEADLTGYLARGMGRRNTGLIETYPELFPIVCIISGNIVSGSILPVDSGANVILAGVWDIEIYDPEDPTNVDRIIQGDWVMNPEVTV